MCFIFAGSFLLMQKKKSGAPKRKFFLGTMVSTADCKLQVIKRGARFPTSVLFEIRNHPGPYLHYVFFLHKRYRPSTVLHGRLSHRFAPKSTNHNKWSTVGSHLSSKHRIWGLVREWNMVLCYPLARVLCVYKVCLLAYGMVTYLCFLG